MARYVSIGRGSPRYVESTAHGSPLSEPSLEPPDHGDGPERPKMRTCWVPWCHARNIYQSCTTHANMSREALDAEARRRIPEDRWCPTCRSPWGKCTPASACPKAPKPA